MTFFECANCFLQSAAAFPEDEIRYRALSFFLGVPVVLLDIPKELLHGLVALVTWVYHLEVVAKVVGRQLGIGIAFKFHQKQEVFLLKR